MTKIEKLKNKQLTKKITVTRYVHVNPIEQSTTYEISKESIDKHIIKRINKNMNIIPNEWELTEIDFNHFLENYDRGYGTRIEINEIDVDWEEFEYMDEELELYSDDVYNLNEKCLQFLLSKNGGSKDEQTTTWIKRYKEEGKKKFWKMG